MTAGRTLEQRCSKARGEQQASRPRSTFDHLLVQALATNGCSLAIEVAGGRPPETPFRLDAVGERGVLRIDGGAARGVQASRLTLLVNGVEAPVEDGELCGLPDAAWNVAATYAALRNDIEHGSSTVVGFDHAIRLTRMINDALASSRGGCCVWPNDWPAP